MKHLFTEIQVNYPIEWEDEYRKTGFIQEWRDKYPRQFEDYKSSTQIGTLDLFAQYALMYILRS